MYIALRPRDGLTLKDPRGFNVGGGVQARSLEWPLPSTVAGTVRTAVGFAAGYPAKPDEAGRENWRALKTNVRVRGPFPLHLTSQAKWSLLWPAPRDAVAFAGKKEREILIEWLSPAPAGGARGLWQVDDSELRAVEALWRPAMNQRDKPIDMPLWWSTRDFLPWLACPRRGRLLDRAPSPVTRFDMHLKVNPDRYTAQDGQLFGHDTMEYLRTTRVSGHRPEVRIDEIAVGVGVDCEEGLHLPMDSLWRMGGEARLVRTERASDALFQFPDDELSEWEPSCRFRIVLVTPAAFEKGWRPSWLEPHAGSGGDAPRLQGTLPGTDIDVVLRAAMVGRPVATSGWDFDKDRPKPSRRLVGPGAAYFFETVDPRRLIEKRDLQELWLRSMHDPVSEAEAARDGFGVAVPGAWPS